MPPDPVPGAKMIYLIRRRAATSRDELVAHWFANHMPGVIENQVRARESGRVAWRNLWTSKVRSSMLPGQK